MNPCPADIARLSLLVQRLLDAEVLPDLDGAVLMRTTEAVRRSLEEGNADAVRRHVEQVARFTAALVCTGVIEVADGRAVLEATRRLLAVDRD